MNNKLSKAKDNLVALIGKSDEGDLYEFYSALKAEITNRLTTLQKQAEDKANELQSKIDRISNT